MDNLLLIRGVGLPALMFIGIFALAAARSSMRLRTRGFLVHVWGSTLLLLANAVATAVLLWADETPGDIARSARLTAVVFSAAIASLVLGLALGWKARVEGERFLVAIVRPPRSVNMRSLRNWAIVPLLFLWLALAAGAFAVTYGTLSLFTPTGR